MNKRLYIKALVEKSEADGILSVAVGSDSSTDRDGEVIASDGWMLDNFKANPVLLFAHDYHRPPIGKVISVYVEGGRLMFKAQFAVNISPEAKMIFDMYDQGFMNAFSVGFDPQEWTDGDGKSAPYRTYTKAELLEISAVPVPANPQALLIARSKGYNLKEVTGIDPETYVEPTGDAPVTPEVPAAPETPAPEVPAVPDAPAAEEPAPEAKAAVKDGDPCVMDDGTEGTMQMSDGQGTLVCMPKAAAETPDKGKQIEDLKSEIARLQSELSSLENSGEGITTSADTGKSPARVEADRALAVTLIKRALIAKRILQSVDQAIGEALRESKGLPTL